MPFLFSGTALSYNTTCLRRVNTVTFQTTDLLLSSLSEAFEIIFRRPIPVSIFLYVYLSVYLFVILSVMYILFPHLFISIFALFLPFTGGLQTIYFLSLLSTA